MNNKFIAFLIILQLNCMLLGMELEPQKNLIQLTVNPLKDIKKEIINHTNQQQWWYLDQLSNHDDWGVDSVCFNSTGTPLVTCSYDNKAHMFDIQANTIVASFKHNYEVNSDCFKTHLVTDSKINSVCFNPARTHLAIGSSDNKARIFDIQKKTLVASFDHNDCVVAVCFNPAGTHLATGSHDNKACIFDIQTNTLVASFKHYYGVIAVCFNAAGTHLATGSHDNKACIFDIQTNTLVASFKHYYGVIAVCFNPTGTHLATGSGDNKVRIFARYDNYTLQQLQLKYALLTWLLIQKPDKTIDTIELLIKDVALQHSVSEETLTAIWSTLPENMQSALWRTMLYKIQKYGKDK